ncbi:MAG: RagB/SusD family nutrient uptake outer membrane protein [Bacteroidales bacterium]|nr:RagB/SusD family nutrient uptake outer membrane protein [Bacteroidales bacterium]
MQIMKIRTIISAFVIASVSSACSGFLDTSIDRNSTGETIATNYSAIWGFGRAFYTPLGYGFGMIDSNIFATASDEAQQTSAQSNVIYFNKGMLNENVNPLFTYYRNYYEGIRAANFFLDYVGDGKGEEMLAQNRNLVTDKENYERDLQSLAWFKAEAHVAKAYYYSELAKMYGGVPIVESFIDDGTMISRSSYDDVVAYIVKEIDDYKDELAIDWKKFTDREGRFTLGVALAIKSRTLLYAASPLHNPENDLTKWEAAASAANELIMHEDLEYSLNPDYGSYFIGGNPLSSPETIYCVRRSQSNNMEKNNYPIATQGGKSGATPTHNLVAAYEYIGTPDPENPYANRDPRLAASIVTNGSTWNGRVIDQSAGATDDMANANASRTGYYLKKFLTDNLNLVQGQVAQHNWVAYRYAEILLNYAEAMNEAFGPDAVPAGYAMSARAALQQVRTRASSRLPKVLATDKDSFREAVKRERRVELAFEDHRYWDLLRWKDAMEVLNNPVLGVAVTKTENGWSYEVKEVAIRTFHERNYYLPFLRSEIENSGNTLEQNPNY